MPLPPPVTCRHRLRHRRSMSLPLRCWRRYCLRPCGAFRPRFRPDPPVLPSELVPPPAPALLAASAPGSRPDPPVPPLPPARHCRAGPSTGATATATDGHRRPTVRSTPGTARVAPPPPPPEAAPWTETDSEDAGRRSHRPHSRGLPMRSAAVQCPTATAEPAPPPPPSWTATVTGEWVRANVPDDLAARTASRRSAVATATATATATQGHGRRQCPGRWRGRHEARRGRCPRCGHRCRRRSGDRRRRGDGGRHGDDAQHAGDDRGRQAARRQPEEPAVPAILVPVDVPGGVAPCRRSAGVTT